MNDNGKRMAAQESATLSSAILNVIRSSFIIDYGVVMEVPEPGVVTVALSVANNNSGIIVTACTYANIASKAFSVNVAPVKGDKVIVLYPRKFNKEMFSPEQDDVIINEYATGYNVVSGIAIPVNRFNEEFHNNSIVFDDGEITAKFAYDSDNEKNNFEFHLSKEGKVTLNIVDNSVDIDLTDSDNIVISDSNGNSIESTSSGLKVTDSNSNVIESSSSGINITDTNNNVIETKSSGIKITDKNGCIFESSSTSIKINGKLEIKK